MLAEDLVHEGLIELPVDQWLRTPRAESGSDLLARYAARLDAAGPSGEIDGFQLIDHTAKLSYYKGRWRDPRPKESGRFVGRRPQAFAADRWCFADVVEGSVARLIDLPIESPLARGCDEAWRLQAALDSAAGRAQYLRTSTLDGNRELLDFFSPLPSWCQRRLDIVGTPLVRSRGALMSYSVPQVEAEEELRFLRELMWTTAAIQVEICEDE
jgi:hypothetical protein